MFAVSVYSRGQNLSGMPSSPACLHRQQEPLESQDWLLILEPHCESVLVMFLQAENAFEAHSREAQPVFFVTFGKLIALIVL